MPYRDHCTGSGARKSQRCSKAISFHSCTTKLSWTHPILYHLISTYVNSFQVSKCIQNVSNLAQHATAQPQKKAEVRHGLHGSRLLLHPGNSAMALLFSHGLCRVRPSLHFSSILVEICCLDGKGDALAFLSTDLIIYHVHSMSPCIYHVLLFLY